MSDSVRPHRQQPTRLLRPWDSPGKNTGGGCHFLLQCMKVKNESEVTQSCPTLHDPMDCSLSGSSTHGVHFWVCVYVDIQTVYNFEYVSIDTYSKVYTLSEQIWKLLFLIKIYFTHDFYLELWEAACKMSPSDSTSWYSCPSVVSTE